jgi:hypothetical protein
MQLACAVSAALHCATSKAFSPSSSQAAQETWEVLSSRYASKQDAIHNRAVYVHHVQGIGVGPRAVLTVFRVLRTFAP